jgi:hypothetical protein
MIVSYSEAPWQKFISYISLTMQMPLILPISSYLIRAERIVRNSEIICNVSFNTGCLWR